MNVEVTGPQILFRIPLFDGIPVTETVVNMWIVMAFIVLVCIFLTRGLKVKPTSKRQIVAETLVGIAVGFVEDTMGKKFRHWTPYISSLFLLSITSSLSSLVGLRPPTADLSVTLAWALLTFVMIQGMKFRTRGFFGYFKSYTEPVVFITPINIVGEIATPISMSFRHFGNIGAGMVITSLVYGALGALSSVILGAIPNSFIASIPIFQLGIPAILSIYFDLLTSFLQAYIFCMLTMVYISNASE